MSRRGGPRDHPGLTRSGLDRSRPIGTLAAPGVRQRARSVDGDGQGYHGRPPLILDPLDPLDTLGLLRVSRGSRVSMVQGDQGDQENRGHPPETAPSVEDDLRTAGPSLCHSVRSASRGSGPPRFLDLQVTAASRSDRDAVIAGVVDVWPVFASPVDHHIMPARIITSVQDYPEDPVYCGGWVK